MGAHTLRDLVLVVRKDQDRARRHGCRRSRPSVFSLIAEHSMCQPGRPRPHGLSQPGWSAFDGFHSTKSPGSLLVRRDLDPCAGDHVRRGCAATAHRIRHRRRPEQHMALCRIGVARGDQPLDHRDHLRDVLGRPRLDVWRQIAERRHVLVEDRRGAAGQRLDRLAVLAGGGDNLVLDIGDVADIAHMVFAVSVTQYPIEQVKRHHRAGIADMGKVVDRRPADIHADVVRIERFERLLAARQRIIESERHGNGVADCAPPVHAIRNPNSTGLLRRRH